METAYEMCIILFHYNKDQDSKQDEVVSKNCSYLTWKWQTQFTIGLTKPS